MRMNDNGRIFKSEMFGISYLNPKEIHDIS